MYNDSTINYILFQHISIEYCLIIYKSDAFFCRMLKLASFNYIYIRKMEIFYEK